MSSVRSTSASQAARLKAAAVAVLLSCVALPEAALAQSWRPSPPPATPPPAATVEEARGRYRRALQLYEREGNAEAALVELERAYDLAPNYRVLYNIGHVARFGKDYVVALGAFERYLADGGRDVPAARRTEVKQAIADLQGFIAHLRVTTEAPDMSILVDDVLVGKTPLAAPIVVNAGRHRITATRDDFSTSEVVSVAGGDKRDVALKGKASAAPAPPQDRPAAPAEPPAPATPPASAPPAHATPEPPAAQPTPRGSPVAWIGWAATGVLAAGTAVTGGLALAASGELKKTSYSGATVPANVTSLSNRVSGLAIAADVCGGAAVAAAAVSLYLTLKPAHPAKQATIDRRGPKVDVGLSATGLGVAISERF